MEDVNVEAPEACERRVAYSEIPPGSYTQDGFPTQIYCVRLVCKYRLCSLHSVPE